MSVAAALRLLLSLAMMSALALPGDSAAGERASPTLAGRLAEHPRISDEWPQVGYSAAHTYFNPEEVILNPSNISTLEEKWNRGVGGSASAPVLAGGRLFVSASHFLSAFDPLTGAVVWTTRLGSHPVSSPAVQGEFVYVTSQESVFAFDATTGFQMWKSNLHAGTLFSPVVDQDVLVTITQPSDVVAMDASTGTVVWTSKRESPVTVPAIADGLVYVVEDYETVTALDAQTGALVWTHDPTALHRPIYQGPSISGDVGFAASSGKTFAFDALTGEGVWNADAEGTGTSLAMDVERGILYVGRLKRSARVSALDAATGRSLWYSFLPTEETSPRLAAANGIVYASAGIKLYALEGSTGSILLTLRFDQTSPSSPIVSGGMLYVTTALLLHAFGLPDR